MPASAAADPWTTRRLLGWMTEAFRSRQFDSPRLCAEMLVSHVVRCERLALYTDPDRPASDAELARLRDLTARALKHEPVQYLVGEAFFFGLRFRADRRALIPRPSTETIVEHALQHLRAAGRLSAPLRIADVCTGSGCIAIALAIRLPEAWILASDLSADALALAHDNAELHGVLDRVQLEQGNLLEPVEIAVRAGGPFDLLVANPPYISDAEWAEVPPNVRHHEPESALRGGADGLDMARPLLTAGPALVHPGGLVMVELAASHAESGGAVASGEGRAVRVLHDFEGLPRVVRIETTPARESSPA